MNLLVATAMNKFDLREYLKLFPEALEERYGSRFEVGFADIKKRYKEVRSGRRLLTADDVMAIFDPSLPFVQDWTKPNRAELEERMKAKDVPQYIRTLDGRYDSRLIGKILYGFKELSLTSLVLQHVYPKKFSMCSHHIASLLYIVGGRKAGRVREYYLEYCQELEKWAKRFQLTVEETEYALWTWYRVANHSEKGHKEVHRRKMERDPWVREQRALRVRESLAATDKLGIARFCVDTDPTLGAIIAWREFEIGVRALPSNRRSEDLKMPELIDRFPGEEKETYLAVWEKRNCVMHNDREISEEEAREVVSVVTEFINRN